MTEISVLEIVVLFVAVIVVGVAVPPYLPRWAAYAASIGIAFHSLVQMIFDGSNIWRVVRLVVFSSLAVVVWWRDLRGTEHGRRRPPSDP